MWRVRQKEIELDKRVKGRLRDKSSGDSSRWGDNSSRSTGRHAIVDNSTGASSSCSSKSEYEHCPEGLKDDELQEFLYSRYYFFLLLSDVLCAFIPSYNLIYVHFRTEETPFLQDQARQRCCRSKDG